MIRQQNYEVGLEFVAAFMTDDKANGAFFTPSQQPDRSLFDLPGYIVHRLERAQVAHIEDLGECTYADPERFFSYRRSTHRQDSDYGRHVSAIALTS
jgi:copper oxidase (laccase) domain-containing protein